jgi:threonine aldolase
MDWELSMMAWFSGCLARTIETVDGLLSWREIERSLKAAGPHNAPTTLISLENTHNMAGGTVYEQSVIDEICSEAHARGLKVHMDGARIFNAAVALGTTVSRVVRDVDSVMFSLSKALAAPVGSILAGTEEAIGRARLYRKRLGGGMRQAGVLGAAGLIALERSPSRLKADHQNARLLADALAGLPGVRVNPEKVQTNIVIFDISGLGVPSSEFSDQLKERGVLANGVGIDKMRLVTHMDVSRPDCERAAAVISEVAAALTAAPAAV